VWSGAFSPSFHASTKRSVNKTNGLRRVMTLHVRAERCHFPNCIFHFIISLLNTATTTTVLIQRERVRLSGMHQEAVVPGNRLGANHPLARRRVNSQPPACGLATSTTKRIERLCVGICHMTDMLQFESRCLHSKQFVLRNFPQRRHPSSLFEDHAPPPWARGSSSPFGFKCGV